MKPKELQPNTPYIHTLRSNVQVYEDCSPTSETVCVVKPKEMFLVLEQTEEQLSGACWIHILSQEKPGYICVANSFDNFAAY